MRVILVTLLGLACANLYAVLPMPYPTEPITEDSDMGEPARDPRQIQGFLDMYSGSKTREMELPTFEAQPNALGYKPGETFVVPPSLKSRVEFWKRIYTEFSSNEAVLHDAEYPQLIYGVLDVKEITADDSLSYRKKVKLLNRILKAEKEKYIEKLKFMHANRSNPTAIPVADFPLFKKFESIDGDSKFLDAADRIRAQIGQRDKIVRGFLYGGRYFHHLMEIFEKKGIPKELTRLPLVESAFNLSARSKVGASGVWQFMRSTGKRFLRIDRAIDERNDPIAAAWAAADLLRQNFDTLGSWPLAITAYNHGREGMARAVRMVGSDDLAEIIRRYQSRTFGFASSNFYSEFLAILEVERDYRTYFGKLLVDAPIEYEEYNVSREVRFESLASACRVAPSELANLNPAFTDHLLVGKASVPQGYMVKVPPGKAEACRTGARTISQRVAPVPTRRLAKVEKASVKKVAHVSKVRRHPRKHLRLGRNKARNVKVAARGAKRKHGKRHT